jgi:hypothetical protein
VRERIAVILFSLQAFACLPPLDAPEPPQTDGLDFTIERWGDGWALPIRELGSLESPAELDDAVTAVGVGGDSIVAIGFDLPLRAPGLPRLMPNGMDTVIAVYSAEAELRWWLVLGGEGDQSVSALEADEHGNIFAAGTTSGSILAGSEVLSATENDQAFLVRLDIYGHVVRYRTIGGAGIDELSAIALDRTRGLLIGGGKSTQPFTISAGCVVAPERPSGEDSFISAFDLETLDCRWAQGFGSEGDDKVNALAVDPARGRVVAAGPFFENNGDPAALHDSYIVELSADDGSAINATSIRGDGDEDIRTIALNPDGMLYVAGVFQFGTNLEYGGRSEQFSIERRPFGLVLDQSLAGLWSFSAVRKDGPAEVLKLRAATSCDGAMVFAGRLDSDSRVLFDDGTELSTLDQDDDGLLVAIDGNGLRWVRTIRASGDDGLEGVACDHSSGHLLLGGHFQGSMELEGGVSLSTKDDGSEDAYLYRFAPNATRP